MILSTLVCVLAVYYLKSDAKGTEVTSARVNHELKMYARRERIMRATAKNRQIIIPAKVRQPGPMISSAEKQGERRAD